MKRTAAKTVFVGTLSFLASSVFLGACGQPLIRPTANREWIQQFGSGDEDRAISLAVDEAGNVYVVGYTDGTLPGQSRIGERDAFVIKYDAGGKELWIRQFGTEGRDVAYSLALDSEGNVYGVGYTSGTFPGQTNSGGVDAFVVKYDAAGKELWSRQFGSEYTDVAVSLAVDGEGNVYVSGGTKGSLPGQASSGDEDAFVIKYDATGNELWIHQFGTKDFDGADAIAVDGAGNIYVAGSTRGTLPGQTRVGEGDVFVRKYDASGQELWTRQFGTRDLDGTYSLAMDSGGNVWISGHTQGTFPGQTSAGKWDAFVAKYDADGKELWTHQFGTVDDDAAYAIAVDGEGNVYMAGSTEGTLPGQTNAGGEDAFVVKYDAGGKQLWIRQFGTESLDVAYSLAVNRGGNVWISGHTQGTFPGQTSAGGQDAFVLKYGR